MSCTQATSIRAAYPREATREELSDIIERAVKSEKEELLKSLVEEVEGLDWCFVGGVGDELYKEKRVRLQDVIKVIKEKL